MPLICLYYTSHTLVLYVSYACTIRLIRLYYTPHTLVLYVSCACTIRLIRLYYTSHTLVLYVSCACTKCAKTNTCLMCLYWCVQEALELIDKIYAEAGQSGKWVACVCIRVCVCVLMYAIPRGELGKWVLCVCVCFFLFIYVVRRSLSMTLVSQGIVWTVQTVIMYVLSCIRKYTRIWMSYSLNHSFEVTYVFVNWCNAFTNAYIHVQEVTRGVEASHAAAGLG